MSTVTVICKLPAGLLAEIGMITDPRTGHSVKGPNYRAFPFNGWNHELRKHFAGQISPVARPPAGITEVPEDFWTEWLRIHRDFYFVKKGLITVAPSKPAEVKAAQKDSAGLVMGFESMDPAGDPRYAQGKPNEIEPLLKDE